jgi:hypothetical protein
LLSVAGSWFGRCAKTDSSGAAKVLDRGAQAVTHGADRCFSQVLDRGAQADARGAAHYASQGRSLRRRDAQ